MRNSTMHFRCGWMLQLRSLTPSGLDTAPSWQCQATTPSTTTFSGEQNSSSKQLSVLCWWMLLLVAWKKILLFQRCAHHIHSQLLDEYLWRICGFLCHWIHVSSAEYSYPGSGHGWYGNHYCCSHPKEVIWVQVSALTKFRHIKRKKRRQISSIANLSGFKTEVSVSGDGLLSYNQWKRTECTWKFTADRAQTWYCWNFWTQHVL